MARPTPHLDIPDLSGKTAVVTGGSDGIGLRIAERLAAAGAALVLPVRNTAKGEAARSRILAASPTARVALQELDLASLASVAAFGERMRADGAPVHLLINNAGLMTPPERLTTVDGHEVQWGTNHLGHVALVANLFPLLRAGRARVTSQVSVAANQGTILWDDLDSERSYDGMRAYSHSKIAFGLFGIELDRRSRALGWGISSNLSHPGVAPTSLLAERPEVGREADTRGRRLIHWMSERGILLGTPESAALPALYAATSPDAQGGRLYGPKGLGHLGGGPAEQRLYSRLRSETDAARIWTVSQEAAGVEFPAT